MKLKGMFICAVAAAVACSCATKTDSIRINQVGFYPEQEKTLTLEQENRCRTVQIYKPGTLLWDGEGQA